MTEYNNTIIQEYTKNHLAKGPKKKNNALEAVLRALNPQRYKISFLSLQSKFAPIERTRRAYIKAVSLQAKRQKQLIQTTETANRPGSGQIFISIFCHFIPLFWYQKPLGCVSKIEFFKKLKILDRGDF